MQTIIGTCSLCNGPVTMAIDWRGTVPPAPTCDWCGARQADGFGPIIKMTQPMISRRAAREGKREDEK